MKNVADIYALSPMQELMLLHAKTARNDHDVLLTQVVYSIDGPLDAGVYRQAWQLMVERHPALRTLFVWQDDKPPVQVVRERVELPWQELDWSDVPRADLEQRLDELQEADRAAGIELMRPPAMRLTLIQLDPSRHWLLWTSHHLVVDRWCTGLLFAEIARAYDALATGTFPTLAPAPAYRSYIEWIDRQDVAAVREHWQEVLRGNTAEPLAASGRPGQAAFSSRSVELHGEDWGALRRVAAANDLTWSTFVLGAWAIVLSAATRTDDAVFGLTVSGRPADLPGAGEIVGSLINNVPFRVQVDTGIATMTWLHRLQDAQLALGQFDYVSPPQIQSWVEDARNGPLFDTLIVMQASEALVAPDSLHIELKRGDTRSAYPLTVSVRPGSASCQIGCTWESNMIPDVLGHELAAGLARVLHAMARDPQRSLDELRTAAGAKMPEPVAALTPLPETGTEGQPYQRRSPTEQVVAQIWAEILGRESIPADEGYFDTGGTSLNAIRLLTAVEARVGRRLPMSVLLTNPTVAEMAAHLGEVALDQIDPVLQTIAPGGDRPPFFYMHGVFGDLLSLSNLVPLFDPELPIYGFEAIGLRPGQAPDRTIEAMAARYVESMRRVQPEGPYFLGGYCFGGVIAYEAARRLRADGDSVALLAIIEGAAPARYHSRQSLFHSERIRTLRHTVPYWLRGYQEFGGWRVGSRLQRRFSRGEPANGGSNGSRAAMDEIDAAETINFADVNVARPQIQMELRSVSYAAMLAYEPLPYPGRVTLFRASALSLSHALGSGFDASRGWSALAEGGVSIRYVGGSHSTMLLMPQAETLAQSLTHALLQAQMKHNG